MRIKTWTATRSETCLTRLCALLHRARVHHFIRLAFAATELSLTTERHAIVGTKTVSVRVNLDTGAIVPWQGGLQRPPNPELSLTLEGKRGARGDLGGALHAASRCEAR
jgi:hypothetical protein